MTHSPEPWRRATSTCLLVLFDDTGRTVLTAGNGNLPITKEEYDRQVMDLDRIVACVNACRFIPTALLQRVTSADYIEPEIAVPDDMQPFRPIQLRFYRNPNPSASV